MYPFNCMYGPPHVGQHVACRNKAGRTVGWLCALHYKNHEKALLGNGYHFRTIEELRARGELDEHDRAAGPTEEGMVLQPEPEPQQSGDDDSGGDSPTTELARERPAGSDNGGGQYGGQTDQSAGGSRGTVARRQICPPQKELETATQGGGNSLPGVQDRTGIAPAVTTPDWPAWTQGAGHLSLTAVQRQTLQSPFDDNDITIRYDGVVYVPWRKYWSRMCLAFEPLVPSVVPIDNPRFQGTEIIVGVVMVCGGQFIGKAWGSHRLEGDNDKMAVGDRIESAISDAIAKIGKRLNMAEDLWDDQFRDWWKSQYAESYKNHKGRINWRRKPVVAVDPIRDLNDFPE